MLTLCPDFPRRCAWNFSHSGVAYIFRPPLPFLGRKIRQRRAELHAGNAFANGIGVCHVKTSVGDLVPACSQARDRSVKLVAVTTVQNDGSAVVGEPTRQRKPDALE